MFFLKSLPRKNGITKKLTINDFAGGLNSVLDDAYMSVSSAKLSFNVSGESGALRENVGVECLTLPHDDGYLMQATAANYNIIRVWLFRRYDYTNNVRDDRIIMLTQNLLLFEIRLYNLSNGVILLGLDAFSNIPEAVNYRLDGRDVIIFCSPTDSMRVYDGINAPQEIEGAPNLKGLCLHYDRLFAFTQEDNATLVFSDDLNPTNWNVSLDEAGFVNLTDERGGINKLISFLNYLYIFRDYGISRLTAIGRQENFNLAHLFVSGGKILGNTVCVCGDKIIFLTERGLFSFDGGSTKKILSRLDGFFEGQDNSNATAAYFEGKYYLSCNLAFGDGKATSGEKRGCINNAMLQIDLESGVANILRGFDVISIAGASSDNFNELLFCFGQNQPYAKKLGKLVKGGKVFDVNCLKKWVCPKTDLNSTNGKKTLIHAFVKTKYDITLCVEADGDCHYFEVSGSETMQKVRIDVAGEEFKVSIFADTEKMCVLRPQFVFKEY